MRIPLVSIAGLAGGLACVGAGSSIAQDFPAKPIRLFTVAVGGGLDFSARLFVPALSASLGQTVVIENRGGGVTPIDIVAKAPSDGYTVLYNSSSTWLLPYLQTKVSYDPVRDLVPVSILMTSPSVLVVHPSLPVKSVKDLIALAKARPGQLNYAAGSTGSSTHLSPELFKSMAAVDIAHIFYKSSGGSIIDLLSGQVQIMFGSAGTLAPHMKTAKVRALAVTSAQPSELLPGLPTIAASGLPGYESVVSYGVFTPAKIANAVVQRLHREFVQVIHRPEIKEKLLGAGIEPLGTTPQDAAAYIKADMAKWSKVIKEAGIKAE